MTNKIPRLNCENFESAVKSVSEIFEISEENLKNEIKSWEKYGDDSPMSDTLISRLHNKFGPPLKHDAVFFHGTRIGNHCTFKTEGVLPKNIIANRIDNIYTDDIGGFKNSLAHEGPFGFLIKEVHKKESYTECPELIEDVYSQSQIEQFCKTSKPCIISFFGEVKSYHLEAAVWYLYLKINRVELYDLEYNYSGEGKKITPDRIIDIEILNYN